MYAMGTFCCNYFLDMSSYITASYCYLYCAPNTDEDETKKMAKVDGGYLFASSLYAALLAFGTDPVTAMGYAAIACLPVFLGVVDLASIDKLCGLDKGGWTFIFLVFFAASAYGMLS